MTVRTLRFALLGLFVALLLAPALPAQTLLRWKFAAGDEFDIVMKQNMTMEMEMPQADADDDAPAQPPVNTSTDMIMDMTWNVESVAADGSAKMTQTIDRMRMDMALGPAGKAEFDTDSDEKPTGMAAMVAGMIKPMIGAPFRQTMGPNGKITEMEVPDAVKKGPIAGALGGEDAFSDMIRRANASLPSEAIDVGHTWVVPIELKSKIGQIEVKTTHTYLGSEQRDGRRQEKIGVKIDMEFGEGGIGGAKVDITEQDNQGVMYFDNQAGRLTESQMTQKMTLEIQIGETAIKQKITTTMTMQVTPAGE